MLHARTRYTTPLRALCRLMHRIALALPRNERGEALGAFGPQALGPGLDAADLGSQPPALMPPGAPGGLVLGGLIPVVEEGGRLRRRRAPVQGLAVVLPWEGGVGAAYGQPGRRVTVALDQHGGRPQGHLRRVRDRAADAASDADDGLGEDLRGGPGGGVAGRACLKRLRPRTNGHPCS